MAATTCRASKPVFEARQKYRDRADLLLLFSTYWLLGGNPHQVDSAIEQTQMGHACEWETSMMLRIRPDLVGNLAEVATVEFGDPFLPASRGWITKDRTVPGHIGAPRGATAEKGETIFRVFAGDVSQLVERRVLGLGRPILERLSTTEDDPAEKVGNRQIRGRRVGRPNSDPLKPSVPTPSGPTLNGPTLLLRGNLVSLVRVRAAAIGDDHQLHGPADAV